MKTLILTFALLISSLSFSQLYLENGYLDTTNTLVYETKSELKEGFRFYKSPEGDMVACIVTDKKGIATGDVLVWDVMKVTIDPEIHTYHVIDADGDFCYMSFYMTENKVIIFDVLKSQFSAMSGDNLSYADL